MAILVLFLPLFLKAALRTVISAWKSGGEGGERMILGLPRLPKQAVSVAKHQI